MLSEWVARALRDVRIDQAMADLAALAEHDRYQASLGIERAAEIVATAATAIGVTDVTIERFAADGATRWWTFAAPRAWTPTTARLEIPAAGICVDHATQPFTIATYSVAARTTARIAGLHGEVAGAIVVIEPADFARPALLAELATRGAIGFVTDAPSRCDLPGRIELEPATTLFGFSVTPAQRQVIAAHLETPALVTIDIDRSARMPVVTGVLPGRDDDEVWLTSHLCHPRPGANDNASGAAALLGVARLLIDRPREHAIRLVWGPEFLGVAALLHERATRPLAVINLDMVGEDPVQCGVPLVVERAPDWCLSPITPLAEHVVEEVFAQTTADAGTWRAGAFYGFSDHALFANVTDPAARRPAVQLWHPGDPFNHSAADTLDKVSPIELRRAIAAGAVLAEVLAGAELPLSPIVERWCAREHHAVAAVAERYRIDHAAWANRLVDHVHQQGAALRAIVEQGPSARVPQPPACGVFAGRWPGPFNYRGLLAQLSAPERDRVVALFSADKRNYAVLTHLAMLADGCTTREQAIDRASLALRYPIEPATAERLWSALMASGWLEQR